MTTRRRAGLAPLLWASTVLVLGSLSLAQAWGHWLPVLALALAALLPMLLLRSVVSLGVSRWAAASVLSILLVLAAYLMSAEAGTSFTRTVSDALPLLLTEPTPLDVRPDLLAAPTLAAGVVSLLVGLRVDQKTRVAPVLGAVALYVAGLLLTSGDADPYGLLAAGIVVTALAGWALLDEHSEPLRRRSGVAAPVAAVAVGLVAVVAAVPATGAFDPREVVESPLTEVEATNPLPQLGAWAAFPQIELLRVKGPGYPLRLVTLSEYDGTQWSSSTRFARLGSTDPSGLPAGQRQTVVTQDIELLELAGPWLPVPGSPTRLSERDALLDTGTGTVYLPDGGKGTRYQVTGRADAPDADALESASVPTTGAFEPYLEVPALPNRLAAYSKAVTRGVETPYERAIAIESAVRGDRKFSARTISGSAYWRIERFLLEKKGSPGAYVGTSEQFATAFAIVARQNGLPTRLVVGFKPGAEQDDGSRIVRGRDAMAWPEVYFDGLGWVPFSPTPDNNTFARDDVDSAPLKSEQPKPSTKPTPSPSGPADTAGDDPTTKPNGEDSSGSLLPVLLGAAVVLPFGGLFSARWLRSARHRRRGARGAWAEVLDYLTLVGRPVAGHESATDVARRTTHIWGTAETRRLADAAELAAFGPTGDGEADLHHALTAVRRAARRSLPAWRRAWWWLDPRPLRRGRRA